MRIALINENSQAAKNSIIEKALRKVVEPMGFEVKNYGMYAADDEAQLTYVQNGILAATLLNAGACDYVITGCGTGEGAMLALNSFPGVICGHVATPLDAYTFAQINDGNAILSRRSTTETRSPFLSLLVLAGAETSISSTSSRSFSASPPAADIPRREQYRSREIRRSSTRSSLSPTRPWKRSFPLWIRSW